MKSKTKKLFLTLFAFASLSLAACAGSNSSSSSGTSESSSQDESSESQSSSESEDEGGDDEGGDDEGGDDDDDDEGEASGLTVNVGYNEVILYEDKDYISGDPNDMAAAKKYHSKSFSVEKYDEITISGGQDGYGFGPNGDGSTDKNNILRPAEAPYKVHNDAMSVKIYVYEYDGVEYGTMAGYSFWLTGHNGNTEDEDVVSVSGIFLATDVNGWAADNAHKFELDTVDSNHYYFHTTFVAGQKFKVYDTSKDSEDARWVSNESTSDPSTYTIDGDGNIVMTVGGEFYVDYYVSSTANHISLYKVVAPVTPVNVNITLDCGEFAVTGKCLYAWVWGNQYGSGTLIASNTEKTQIILDSLADGFVLVQTNAEATVLDKFPTDVHNQSANIDVIKAGTLNYRETNQEGKAVFAYTGDVAPDPDPAVHTNYLMVERGSESTKYELENYNESEYKLLNVELKYADEFSFCVHVGTIDQWVKYANIKSDTDASVKAKFSSVVSETASNGNFKVETAGTFDFYVAKDGTVVYIANHTEPVVNHYTITIGTQTYDLVEGEPFTDGDGNTYEQWSYSGPVAADAVISFHNNEDVINPVMEANTKFEQNATTKVITCKTAGTYDFYVKLRYQDDKLYIGDHVEPATKVDYVIKGASFDLDTASAKVVAWVWGGTAGKGAWVDDPEKISIDSTNKKVVKVELHGSITGMKIIRVPGTTVQADYWNSVWNHTGDITLVSGTTEYTISASTW